MTKPSNKDIQFLEENGFVVKTANFNQGLIFTKESKIRDTRLEIIINSNIGHNAIYIRQYIPQNAIIMNVIISNFKHIEDIVNNFLDFLICNFELVNSKVDFPGATVEFFPLIKDNNNGYVTKEFLILVPNKQRECVLISNDKVKKYISTDYILLMKKLYSIHGIDRLGILSENINNKISKTLNKTNKKESK